MEITDRLRTIYALAERSAHVFGSPLGPFLHGSRQLYLPRFVYFGPHTSDESLRLAFYAGFDHQDLRGSLALFHFIERLALESHLGQGLHLTFFPLVDVGGLFTGETGRRLARRPWHDSASVELAALEHDARLHGYHGFVRLVTEGDGDDIAVCLRSVAASGHPPVGVELLSSAGLGDWPVRWEAEMLPHAPAGPLAVGADLPFAPFELVIDLPRSWLPELQREAAAALLKNFVVHYRGVQAFAQHL